jgi:hypothetical protein
MNKIFILSLILLLNVFSIFSVEQKTDGQIITELRTLPVFHTIKMNCSGKIILTQGKDQIIMVKTDNKALANLKTDVAKGELTITLGGFSKPAVLEIEITMPDISDLEVNGSGKIEVKNEINSSNLSFIVNGNGSITAKINSTFIYNKIFGSGNILLAGKTKSLEVDIFGSGQINSLDLGADDLKAKLSGGGVCKSSVNNDLNLEISGTGELKYNGQPKVKLKINGSGTVESL